LSEEQELVEAAEQANTTVGDYARKLVREGLHSGPVLGMVRHELEVLHRDFVNATLALLVNAGKCTPAEANAWVEEVLERKQLR